jgi:hypothetical protein
MKILREMIWKALFSEGQRCTGVGGFSSGIILYDI